MGHIGPVSFIRLTIYFSKLDTIVMILLKIFYNFLKNKFFPPSFPVLASPEAKSRQSALFNFKPVHFWILNNKTGAGLASISWICYSIFSSSGAFIWTTNPESPEQSMIKGPEV